jgi:hypothetical protein
MTCRLNIVSKNAAIALTALAATALSPWHDARAEDKTYLETVHRHATLASTVPGNGDLNPYALYVAPVSAGKIQKDDVLVDNFNNISNLQGTGGTIVLYTPSTKKTALFASLPQHLAQCPGGVGLSTAMVMLKSGWVIVGSAPSTDGTTKTKGPGCLLVLDANGQLAATWSGPNIDTPWGNMAVTDNSDRATLYISMAGFDVPGPDVIDPATHAPVIVRKATVLRLDLQIAEGKVPSIASETVIADGFAQRADRDSFLVGPTGVALGENDTLYVSDAVDNRVVAIEQASTRTTSAGTGRDITRDGLLRRPLAMVTAPNGHLLTTNAKNGQVVEIDPVAGKQLIAQWIDANPAQTPPGNGDLFGLAMKSDGSGFYYVEDDVNMLVETVR